MNVVHRVFVWAVEHETIDAAGDPASVHEQQVSIPYSVPVVTKKHAHIRFSTFLVST